MLCEDLKAEARKFQTEGAAAAAILAKVPEQAQILRGRIAEGLKQNHKEGPRTKKPNQGGAGQREAGDTTAAAEAAAGSAPMATDDEEKDEKNKEDLSTEEEKEKDKKRGQDMEKEIRDKVKAGKIQKLQAQTIKPQKGKAQAKNRVSSKAPSKART